MRALIRDAFNKDVRVVDPQNLQDYYKLLNCSSVDVTNKKISDKQFNLIFDEEAELLETRRPSAMDDYGQAVLFNNLIIAGEGSFAGDFKDITDEEIEYVKKYIHTVRTSKYPCGCLFLCHVG